MAGLRSKTVMPIGSAPWIYNERSSALQFIEQEVEEFSYSTRNELDWLNEHMADIFNNTTMTVTEIFKTPGRLRGKPPRTVRKRNALESRAPLTDIFAPNLRGSTMREESSHKPSQHNKVLSRPFEDAQSVKSTKKTGRTDQRGKENGDSGYHGSTENEVDNDSQSHEILHANFSDVLLAPMESTTPQGAPPVYSPKTQIVEDEDQILEDAQPIDEATTDEDHSEKEISSNHDVLVYHEQYTAQDQRPNSVVDDHCQERTPATSGRGSPVANVPELTVTPTDDAATSEVVEHQAKTQSPSERSSPAQQVIRKSSLSFAALPAREPLAAKSSIGGRISHTVRHEHSNTRGPAYTDTLARPLAADDPVVSYAEIENAARGDGMEIDEEEKQADQNQDTEDLTITKLHRKTSTQRLHERISQLGQSQPSRPTKSVTSFLPQSSQTDPSGLVVAVGHEPTIAYSFDKPAIYHEQATANRLDDHRVVQKPPQLLDELRIDTGERHLSPTAALEKADDNTMDADTRILAGQMTYVGGVSDDIQYPPMSQIQSQPQGDSVEPEKIVEHGKSASTSTVSTVTAMAAPREIERPTTATTQAAVRSHRTQLEQSRQIANNTVSLKSIVDGPVSASKAKLSSLLKSARGIFVSSAGISAQAKLETMSPSAMQLRSHTARSSAESAAKVTELSIRSTNPENAPGVVDTEPPPQSQPQCEARKTKESKRPIRPGKAATSKAKPVPVSIKVGTASQRELDHRKVNPPNINLSSSVQHSLVSSVSVTKPPTLQNKSSTTSLRKVTSNTNLKTNTSTVVRPRALAAAARKKEQEEREAQRKVEAKREMESKKLAQKEEERRREQQRKETETQRQREQATQAEDLKRAAQRQAIEKRRMENAKKQEQQKNAQMGTRVRANERVPPPPSEKASVQVPLPRGEFNATKTVSKLAATNVRGLPEDFNRSITQPPVNPARPPKRAAEVDDGEERPTVKVGQSYLQMDAKRRHTDEEDEQMAARQAMPPPMRQSNFRRDIPPTKATYPPGYNGVASSQAGQHYTGPGLSKAGAISQLHVQYTSKSSVAVDMAKFATSKIPFAEGSGNSGLPTNTNTISTSAGGSNHVAASSSKAAARPTQMNLASKTTKTTTTTSSSVSPQYPEGDAISLPEIPTDSEDDDEDDDNNNNNNNMKDFSVPDWAQSPALASLLANQQLVDPEQVFGPIAPLHMEEIFKNKDRHHRFRSRTSSANWSGQDRLTQEEIQRDLEARRKLIANGEWTFGLS